MYENKHKPSSVSSSTLLNHSPLNGTINHEHLEDIIDVKTSDIRRFFPDPKLINSPFSTIVNKYQTNNHVANTQSNWVNEIQMTEEAVFSITPHKSAKWITNNLIRIHNMIRNRDPTTIVDATANVGGNCISFAKDIASVTAYEIKEKTSIVLKHNLSVYNLANINVKRKDFNYSILHDPEIAAADIVFIDPPWYIEDKKNVNFTLDYKIRKYPIAMEETILNIFLVNPSAIVAVKLPKCEKLRFGENSIIGFKKMDILVYWVS